MSTDQSKFPPIRRVITGHDKTNVAKVIMESAATNHKGGASGATSTLIWSTHSAPADIAIGEGVELGGKRLGIEGGQKLVGVRGEVCERRGFERSREASERGAVVAAGRGGDLVRQRAHRRNGLRELATQTSGTGERDGVERCLHRGVRPEVKLHGHVCAQ